MKNGEVIKEFEPVVLKERIAKPQAIKTMQTILEHVVSQGLGKKAGSRSFKVAGKTGTAQVADQYGGYHSGTTRYWLSFAGYFPADNPKYTCIVYLFDVKKRYGSGEAAKLFSNIAHQIIYPAKEIDKSERYLVARRPVRWQTLKSAIHHWKAGKMPDEKADYCLSSKEEQTLFNPYTVIVRDSVPNVIGFSASDAIAEIRKFGHRTQISGKGTVISQSFTKENNTVTLTLSP